MKRVFIITILVLGIFVFQGTSSCVKTDSFISKIDISYVSFNVTSITNVICSEFPFWFQEIKKNKTIVDSIQKKELMEIINKLDTVSNTEKPLLDDTRATIDIIKSNGEVLHFCIDRFYTKLNDSIYFKTSEELRNFIEK